MSGKKPSLGRGLAELSPLLARRAGTLAAEPAVPEPPAVSGERRWRAAQMAGLNDIPAVIRNVPDEAAVSMALIENIQREDLNPLEEAGGRLRPLEGFGLSAQAAAPAGGALARRGEQFIAPHGAGRRGQGIAGTAPHRNGACTRAAGPDLAPPTDRSGR